jgi:glycosyltransferase involved in cell wall biosynthesis
MPTLHFFRWTNQLKDAGHEVFWFDISGMSSFVSRLDWLHQKVDWKLKYRYPGRFFIKKSFPKLYSFIQRYNEYKTEVIFENYIQKIKPDLVHSFALYVSCTPIYGVMRKHQQVKWIYSSWGSDLFYFKNIPAYLVDIQKILPRINFLFTDCLRDYELAKTHGFEGKFLGVFPGGGGYDLQYFEQFKLPVEKRKTILIKGFQGRSGRAVSVLKAIEKIKSVLKDFEIVVFGADSEVINYYSNAPLNKWKNFSVIGKVKHEVVLQLMGKALIYIGNSDSDGMPNTLLEAICAGAFPIQSNPGGATSELIENNKNGMLINNCENSMEIAALIGKSIEMEELIKNAFIFNQLNIMPRLEIELIKKQVLEGYNSIISKK